MTCLGETFDGTQLDDDASMDSVAVKKPTFLQKLNQKLDVILRSFSKKDTNYIEPQQYDFTAMVQHTQVYQYTNVVMQSGDRLTLSPDVVFKLGPYFGWKWLFLGTTVDVKSLFKSTNGTYIDLSLYSNQIGLDIYYIDNGSNFKIRHLKLKDQKIDTSPLNGQPLSALSEHTGGFNIYYILNHHKFSYPAAFSQSTRQKRSAASAMAGIGYSHHKFNIDYLDFITQISESVSGIEEGLSDGAQLSGVHYRSFTLSGGWGYNHVFNPCLLLGMSLMGGLSYNVTESKYREGFYKVMKNISLGNITFDVTARLGLVYNTSKWFTGLSAIMHNYNYKTKYFRTNNFYGTLNIYGGFYFDIKKKKR
jgi:hypothetical protein